MTPERQSVIKRPSPVQNTVQPHSVEMVILVMVILVMLMLVILVMVVAIVQNWRAHFMRYSVHQKPVKQKGMAAYQVYKHP